MFMTGWRVLIDCNITFFRISSLIVSIVGNWDFEHGHGDQWDNWDMLEIVRSLKMVGPFTFGNILLLSNKVKSVYKPSSQTKRKIHIWLRWVLTREQWHWQGRAVCLELAWNVFFTNKHSLNWTMGYRRWQGGVGRLECDISTVGVARTDIGERSV